MEKNKKELKFYSIVILIIVALVITRNIIDICVNGITQSTELPKGVTEKMVNIATIVLLVLGFVMLVPQIFIGVKGLLIANNVATKGKAHIVWALILAVLSGISAVSCIADLFKEFNTSNVIDVAGNVVDMLLYVFYYMCARKIANEE